MKKLNANRSFLDRLLRCARGEAAEKIVVIGLGITAAAVAGSRLIPGAENAATTVAKRVNMGGDGNSPTAK